MQPWPKQMDSLVHNESTTCRVSKIEKPAIFDPKDIMIQDYMIFLFESDLAFLGMITLILLQVILLTLSRSDVIPVCKLYLQ